MPLCHFIMDALNAIIQLLCFFWGNADRAEFKECLKTHTQQQCEQLWRDKK
jgi:hypothetical protein